LTRTVLSEMGHLIAFKETAAIFEDDTETTLRSASRGATVEENSSHRHHRQHSRQMSRDASAAVASAAPPLLLLGRHDVQQLGLDPSSEGPFVEELSQIYFNADVRVQGSYGAWLQSLVCCSNHTCCYLCS